MYTRLTIAGSGGQGIMFMGQLLSMAAWEAGSHTTFFPTYGPQQRGGVSSCRIVFSDGEIFDAMPTTNDVFIGMNNEGIERYGFRLKEGGTLLVNASQAQVWTGKKWNVIPIQADKIALELGDRKSSNMVMLGAFCALGQNPSEGHLIAAMKRKMAGKEALFALNEKAVRAGAEAARGGEA